MPVSIDLTDTDRRDALRAPVSGEKPSLIGMTRDELADALRACGVAERQIRMRVQQLWHWLYVRGVDDFDAMLNVSRDLRAALKERYGIARPEIVDEQI